MQCGIIHTNRFTGKVYKNCKMKNYLSRMKLERQNC